MLLIPKFRQHGSDYLRESDLSIRQFGRPGHHLPSVVRWLFLSHDIPSVVFLSRCRD